MKVVAFNGSARRNGNTSILIRTALGELEAKGIETELVQLAGKEIGGCRACRKCFEKKDGKCSGRVDDLYTFLFHKSNDRPGIKLLESRVRA
jgi:multimeric flavodoxin WrbA